jgi:NAD(P)-dependent dehydrogenase (short-subunit alcohol dehydrogenase family)
MQQILKNEFGLNVFDRSSLIVRDLTHNINVKGVWWGCKYAILSMKKHGKGGSIINTASMVAKVGSAAPQIACTSLDFTAF